MELFRKTWLHAILAWLSLKMIKSYTLLGKSGPQGGQKVLKGNWTNMSSQLQLISRRWLIVNPNQASSCGRAAGLERGMLKWKQFL